MRVLVVGPKRILYEGNARQVVLCGEDGEFSVLDFHQAFLSRLKEGNIRIRAEERKPEILIMAKRGMAKMQKNELSVMAETSE